MWGEVIELFGIDRHQAFYYYFQTFFEEGDFLIFFPSLNGQGLNLSLHSLGIDSRHKDCGCFTA